MLVTSFLNERSIFHRELSSHYYSPSQYFFAKLATVVPLRIFVAILQVSIIYFLVGFKANAVNFLVFVAVDVLVSISCSCYGLAISSLSRTASVSLVASQFVILSLTVICGKFVTPNSIPSFMIWLYYISLFSYAYKILVYTEFKDLNLKCVPQGKTFNQILFTWMTFF